MRFFERDHGIVASEFHQRFRGRTAAGEELGVGATVRQPEDRDDLGPDHLAHVLESP